MMVAAVSAGTFLLCPKMVVSHQWAMMPNTPAQYPSPNAPLLGNAIPALASYVLMKDEIPVE